MIHAARPVVIVTSIRMDVTSDIRNAEMNPFPLQYAAEIVTFAGGDEKKQNKKNI